jgi:hypothetical protein
MREAARPAAEVQPAAMGLAYGATGLFPAAFEIPFEDRLPGEGAHLQQKVGNRKRRAAFTSQVHVA